MDFAMLVLLVMMVVAVVVGGFAVRRRQQAAAWERELETAFGVEALREMPSHRCL